MRLFADGPLAIAAVQRKASGFDRQKAGEGPEQARFPRSVRPGYDQRHPGGGFERESGDDPPPAALDRQVPGPEPHCISVWEDWRLAVRAPPPGRFFLAPIG